MIKIPINIYIYISIESCIDRNWPLRLLWCTQSPPQLSVVESYTSDIFDASIECHRLADLFFSVRSFFLSCLKIRCTNYMIKKFAWILTRISCENYFYLYINPRLIIESFVCVYPTSLLFSTLWRFISNRLLLIHVVHLLSTFRGTPWWWIKMDNTSEERGQQVVSLYNLYVVAYSKNI